MSGFNVVIFVLLQGIFLFLKGLHPMDAQSLSYNRRFLSTMVNGMFVRPSAHHDGAILYGSAIGNHVGQQQRFVPHNNFNPLMTTVSSGSDIARGLCAAVNAGRGTCYGLLPGDCSKYVKCCDSNGHDVNGIVMQCPFGTFWKQTELKCVPSSEVRCEFDPCRHAPNEFTYGMEEYGCRAYWLCMDSHSIGSCCVPGTRYVEGIGCMWDLACNDPCPPMI